MKTETEQSLSGGRGRVFLLAKRREQYKRPFRVYGRFVILILRRRKKKRKKVKHENVFLLEVDVQQIRRNGTGNAEVV